MARVGCDVRGCDGRHFSRGYCRKHYQRVLRHGHTGLFRLPRCVYVGKYAGPCRRGVRKCGETICYHHRRQIENTGVYADGGGPRGERDIMST